jgi:hypothetical protein
MTVFHHCSDIGKEGVEQVVKLIEARQCICFDTQKLPGHIMLDWQYNVGDVLYRASDGRLVTVEVKTEWSASKNLFLETWSNREWGRQTVGWMLVCRSEFLAYVFLETKEIYVANMRRLWEWLFTKGNHRRYPEKKQGRNVQLNKTFGLTVPIEHLRNAGIGFTDWTVNTF